LENLTMRSLHLVVLAAALLPFATTQAAPADVPETGQTLCFDAAGTGIACTNTGQDGDLKAGVAWPNPRFVLNECGTPGVTSDDVVTDKLTGLMWVRAPSATNVDWATALTTANSLTLCGFSDWRLPNIQELESLVNSGAANQATFLNGQGFTGVAAVSYWSSTSSALFSDTAWLVIMSDGSVDTNMKTFGLRGWPVRAGK
jgi:hypothetical protein